MADWYASSAAYSAVAQWAASHAYSVGDFVRALAAPAQMYQYFVFRCTTAGTSGGSEPGWSTAGTNNATIASGGATFTNVTGQSAYGWSAAAGTLYTLSNVSTTRLANGDRIFISSDHSETLAAATTFAFGTTAFGVIQILSVNRAGSVPPIAADLAAGAAITLSTGTFTLEATAAMYWQGVTFSNGGTSSFVFNSATVKTAQYRNCAFVFTNAAASAAKISASNPAQVIWNNTTVQFSNVGQSIGVAAVAFDFNWLNTASAIVGATKPTTLFTQTGSGAGLITCRGVDLSATSGTLADGGTGEIKILLDSCRINSALTRYATPGTTAPTGSEVELVNCYDGTNILNERYAPGGTVTTDRSTTLSGGAQDDVGNYSLKMVSSTRSDFITLSLDCFVFDAENTNTGASKTATVEIISSASLNNNDIRLVLQYMGTSGNPIASFGDSLATVLTAASALSSSLSTWNNPPGTPQKQLLQVTFTPQRAGRVRGLVRLGKVSTTVWIDPKITIT